MHSKNVIHRDLKHLGQIGWGIEGRAVDSVSKAWNSLGRAAGVRMVRTDTEYLGYTGLRFWWLFSSRLFPKYTA